MAAVAGLHPAGAGRIAYREEVHHPALAAPETATGVLGITSDGRLLRDQMRPRREISEVGDDFVTLREAPDGPANLIPIPAEARPMFAAIRHAIAGEAAAIARDFALTLEPAPAGWRVRLVPKGAQAQAVEVVLAGCGAVLTGMEIVQPGGLRRVMSFEWQR